MTAPVDVPADPAPVAALPPTSTVPSPANMPASQPPVAAAPTTEKPADKPDGEENAELAKVRREAANYRTKLREQEAAAATAAKAAEESTAESASLKDILAKLSAVLNPDANTPPDPAKLAEQLTAAQAETAKVAAEYQKEIRDLTIRASLPGVLAKANADPTLTEAVLTANGALAKLDPAADSFAADLESAVAAAVDANPRLKVAPVAARSGAEIPGRSGGSEQLTREQVAQLAKTPGALDKARREGRLKSLGIV